MGNNTSVLIRYSNKNRYKFQWYAEFLRFIGYFVCEDLKEDSDSDELLSEYTYDLEIDLDTNKETEIYYDILCKFNGTAYELNYLKKVFEDYNLFQAAVTLQYFRLNSTITDKAGKKFKEAVNELDALDADIYEINYAMIYCRQKANLACFLCKKTLYYNVDELGSMCAQFANEYPGESNIYMLLGLIFENYSWNSMNAVNAFIEAKDMIGEKPYVSSVLYKLGKACEGEENLRSLMNDAYENAYNTMPKYSNTYKIAQIYMKMEIYNEAIEFFEECLHKLENRDYYMDPLEQEYLFKVNANLSYLSIRTNDYFSAVEYAGNAKKLKQRIKDSIDDKNGFNKFYYEIYGNTEWNVKDVINIELSRMSEYNVDKYLLTAYHNMGLDDVATKILGTKE